MSCMAQALVPGLSGPKKFSTGGQVGDYTDPNSADGTIRRDWARYAAPRAGWSRAQHVANFGRVVQTTFRQAVVRIVRRAKWRRIIKALILRARLGGIPTLGSSGWTAASHIHAPPRMWPRVRDPDNNSDQEVSNYQARFGPSVPIGPSESVYHYGGLRGTGTRGFD